MSRAYLQQLLILILSITLAPRPTCPPLTAPGSGTIDCSLRADGEANPGDTCTFKCDAGHVLGGSTNRTCLDDGTWSGTDTTCTGAFFLCCINLISLSNSNELFLILTTTSLENGTLVKL